MQVLYAGTVCRYCMQVLYTGTVYRCTYSIAHTVHTYCTDLRNIRTFLVKYKWGTDRARNPTEEECRCTQANQDGVHATDEVGTMTCTTHYAHAVNSML